MKAKAVEAPKKKRPYAWMGKDSKNVNVRLPNDVWEALQERADLKAVSVSELMRAALSEWLLAAKVNRPISARVRKS